VKPAAPPRAFVAALRPALRQAAAIARALEGQVANRPKRGERSAIKAALTAADTAAQEALLVRLLEAFPGVGLEAEEDTPTVRRFPRRGSGLVVVDPIDGTLRSYLRGVGPYSVLIGLARRRRFEAALVALPREGLFFDALLGGGARMARTGQPPRRATPAPLGRRIFVSRRGYEPVRASGGAIAVAPLVPGVCAGLRVAKGRRGISRRGRVGVLVAREAGLLVRGKGRAAFPEAIDARAPVLRVAANERELAILDEVLARLD
jgi:hypothetical protein